VPDVTSLFGKDILERVKYGVVVLAVGVLMLLPQFFSVPSARAVAVVVSFAIVVFCMRRAAYELVEMVSLEGWNLKAIRAILLGIIVVAGLLVALGLAVLEWRLYLVLLLGTFATDSFALLGGRVAKYIAKWRPEYQSHPMTKFSENKTMEGLVTGVVLGWAVTYLTLYACVWWAGLVVSWTTLVLMAYLPIVAVIGDYFESVTKRSYGIKDSGTCLGPHGGLLDRIDSVCAVYASVGLALLLV